MTDYLAEDREAEIDRQIGASYTPQLQDNLLGAEWTARAMIVAEPWEPSKR